MEVKIEALRRLRHLGREDSWFTILPRDHCQYMAHAFEFDPVIRHETHGHQPMLEMVARRGRRQSPPVLMRS